MIDTGLAGKVALITGANHGIGAATAKALAAQGAAVFITYLRIPRETSTRIEPYSSNQARSADAVVRAVREQGGRAAAAEADLAVPTTIPGLFDQAEAAFGPVEVLVNNAAHCVPDTLFPAPVRAPSETLAATLTAATFDRHLAVNSRAAALLMAELARRHRAGGRRWGRIVNLSTDGAHCFPGEVSYGASKATVEALTRSAAVEFAPLGITVNAVSPGPVQTGWISPELEQRILPAIPLGRLGQPEDVADVIVFLASEQARWVTGQVLKVGGGHAV